MSILSYYYLGNSMSQLKEMSARYNYSDMAAIR